MKLLITSTLLLLAMSPLAQANHKHNSRDYNRGSFKAKVVDATPIYKYQTVRQPHAYCEPVNRHYSGSRNKHAEIIGGIVGGLVGHATGDRRHKGISTIAGAVIGSSLAHNITHNKHKRSRGYQSHRQNCSQRHDRVSKVRVIDGYRVTYRSQGKLYRTFRQNRPAKYIRIKY